MMSCVKRKKRIILLSKDLLLFHIVNGLYIKFSKNGLEGVLFMAWMVISKAATKYISSPFLIQSNEVGWGLCQTR